MNEVYKTSDLALAAFLLASGFALLEIERVEGDYRRVFHFPHEARPVAAEYFRGAQVPARAFANAMRDLKAQVRAE